MPIKLSLIRQKSGLSSATGVAGFPNGETFRIGSPDVKVFIARLYLEQRFAIGKQTELVTDDLNQVAGQTPVRYLSIRAGKFSIADFFDNNEYSHDPRTQFMNWSLMSNGAWDYPANTRSYTIGVCTEYHTPRWAVRLSATQVPAVANGSVLDKNIGKAYGLSLETEHTYSWNGRKGTTRLLLFRNLTRSGNYNEAVQVSSPGAPDITAVRRYGNTKYGICLSANQEIGKYWGAFVRAGINDGKNETWAFTEIDQTVSAGVMIDGKAWKRKDHALGMAIVINGISKDHRLYLQKGAYGFIIGDGRLQYGAECIYEMFYTVKIPKLFLTLSPDYQFVLNPAYNKDRGPVHFFALRAHVEM